MDVNAVITNLCDVDPILGAPESMPEYHTEAKVFVPNERIINLVQKVNDPFSISQNNVPFIQGILIYILFYLIFSYIYINLIILILFAIY